MSYFEIKSLLELLCLVVLKIDKYCLLDFLYISVHLSFLYLQLVEMPDVDVELLQVLLGLLAGEHEVSELLLLVAVLLGDPFLGGGDGVLQPDLVFDLVQSRGSAVGGPLYTVKVSVC